jgi:hypothetical protein
MTATSRMWSGAVAVALSFSVAGTAMAQETPRATNDPAVGGQLNQCWGKVASQLAQMGRDDDIPGGGLGSHSRSTTAANNVGGFASDNNDFGITLSQLDPETGNHGRDGVGNVSAGPIHNTNPGDGGNGQHAINNGNLAAGLDPVDGQGAGEQIPCEVP